MGWYDNPDWTLGNQYYTAKGSGVRIYNKNGNLVLYAGWEQQSVTKVFTITFDPDGGSGNMNPQKVEEGKTVKINANKFTKKGYTFDGWALVTNGTLIKYADQSSIKCTSDSCI